MNSYPEKNFLIKIIVQPNNRIGSAVIRTEHAVYSTKAASLERTSKSGKIFRVHTSIVGVIGVQGTPRCTWRVSDTSTWRAPSAKKISACNTKSAIYDCHSMIQTLIIFIRINEAQILPKILSKMGAGDPHRKHQKTKQFTERSILSISSGTGFDEIRKNYENFKNNLRLKK